MSRYKRRCKTRSLVIWGKWPPLTLRTEITVNLTCSFYLMFSLVAQWSLKIHYKTITNNRNKKGKSHSVSLFFSLFSSWALRMGTSAARWISTASRTTKALLPLSSFSIFHHGNQPPHASSPPSDKPPFGFMSETHAHRCVSVWAQKVQTQTG